MLGGGVDAATLVAALRRNPNNKARAITTARTKRIFWWTER